MEGWLTPLNPLPSPGFKASRKPEADGCTPAASGLPEASVATIASLKLTVIWLPLNAVLPLLPGWIVKVGTLSVAAAVLALPTESLKAPTATEKVESPSKPPVGVKVAM